MKLKIGLFGMIFLVIVGIVVYVRYIDKEKLHGDFSRLVTWGEKAKDKLEQAGDKFEDYQQKFEKLSEQLEKLEQDYGHMLETDTPETSEDPLEAAAQLNNAAMLAANKKDYDRAEELLKQSITQMELAENSTDQDKAELYKNYASILEIQGKQDEANMALKNAEKLDLEIKEEPKLWQGVSGARVFNFAP